MSLRSDCLLAVTGIFPDEITPKEHGAAMDVLPRWERKLRAWVIGDQGAFEYKEPPDLEKLFMLLAVPIPQATLDDWVHGLGAGDAELVVDYALPGKGVQRARDYVVNAWPKFSIAGPAGPEILPLSTDDAHEMWSLIQVLDDPDRVLEEMESLTLTDSQALAFLTCYPDLHGWALGILQDELSNRRAKGKGFDLGSEKEAMLETLKGLPPEPPMPQPAPPPVPDKEFEIDAEREETQAEVSSAPKRPRK